MTFRFRTIPRRRTAVPPAVPPVPRPRGSLSCLLLALAPGLPLPADVLHLLGTGGAGMPEPAAPYASEPDTTAGAFAAGLDKERRK